MKLIVHVGAHKTATSYLQSMLASNRAALANAGVGYVPLETIRTEFTRRLGKLSAKEFFPAVLAERFSFPGAPKPDILCYSDENLIGTCPQIVESRQLYPEAGRHLSVLAANAKVDTTICLSVRSQATFLVSAWAEALRTGRFTPFPEFIQEALHGDLSWLPVIERLRQAHPRARLMVWRYEDFKELLPQVIRALTGERVDLASLKADPKKRVRPSMSMQGYRVLHLMDQILGREAAQENAKRVSLTAITGKFGGPIRPLSVNQAAELESLYTRDLETLRTHPGITFLRPATERTQ